MDGNWLAYTSNESGRSEVYITSFPSREHRWPISIAGGIAPLWARDGKQLFYEDAGQMQMWAVDVHKDQDPLAGRPRPMFELSEYSTGGPIRPHDLSRDGQRFLMVKTEQIKPSPVTEMILVQNWFEELKQKVPAGKK
jgi:hypothetical protein